MTAATPPTNRVREFLNTSQAMKYGESSAGSPFGRVRSTEAPGPGGRSRAAAASPRPSRRRKAYRPGRAGPGNKVGPRRQPQHDRTKLPAAEARDNREGEVGRGRASRCIPVLCSAPALEIRR